MGLFTALGEAKMEEVVVDTGIQATDVDPACQCPRCVVTTCFVATATRRLVANGHDIEKALGLV